MENNGAKFSLRPNKSNQFCSVFGCNSISRRNPELRFHSFPSRHDNTRRSQCEHNLRIGKKLTKYMIVFLLHFTREDLPSEDYQVS